MPLRPGTRGTYLHPCCPGGRRHLSTLPRASHPRPRAGSDPSSAPHPSTTSSSPPAPGLPFSLPAPRGSQCGCRGSSYPGLGPWRRRRSPGAPSRAQRLGWGWWQPALRSPARPRGSALRARPLPQTGCPPGAPPPARARQRPPAPALHAAPGIDPEHASPPGRPAGRCPRSRTHPRLALPGARPRAPPAVARGPTARFTRSLSGAAHPCPARTSACAGLRMGVLTVAPSIPFHLQTPQTVRTCPPSLHPQGNQNLSLQLPLIS